MQKHVLLTTAFIVCGAASSGADDPVFSGPQVGEKLAPFQVRGVFDGDAGRDYDLVTRAGGKPLLLVFVHEANRPSIALTRVLMTYAAGRADDGLVAGVVWLADDMTAAEQFLRRARHALPSKVPIGISPDGAEGPGAYGLNRRMTLTILVGKAGAVTANFALVQPSVQADAPKVLAKVAELVGGTVPRPAELAAMGQPATGGRPGTAEETDPRLVELLRAVIRKNATVEQVDRASLAVEDYVTKDVKARAQQIGRIARRVVDSGRLETYGTPRARDHLRTWAERYGPTQRPPKDGESPGSKPGSPK